MIQEKYNITYSCFFSIIRYITKNPLSYLAFLMPKKMPLKVPKKHFWHFCLEILIWVLWLRWWASLILFSFLFWGGYILLVAFLILLVCWWLLLSLRHKRTACSLYIKVFLSCFLFWTIFVYTYTALWCRAMFS